ncbi:chemotaxis-specific protein-glutamate methyltransferase CheB [Halobacteriovorax sp. GB3]|uniref:chemotaxis-specific protein-glutamate methyltransferase CheB n=1 Tax=Halobacteriovorax sp. GB3 TaxID=2719615 RepID=UPI00235E9DEE|nr:chemotaxis-specific protein-glutamate methyltransferase CheB [Halobacteriovorax sp. GB3]MDD0854204.1 chemotaxis-specific protein-glutamate methyltransferase CheB [Halobacteriovorax sp. GB3]
MIVDDSIVYRSAISQALNDVPEVEVFKAVSNGKIAIDFLKQNPDIDLITLDLEMPVMDGIETLKNIRAFNRDVNIIVFSSFTTRGAEKTIDALSAGADDFVPKVEGGNSIEESIEMIKKELVHKIKAFASRTTKRSEVKKIIQQVSTAERQDTSSSLEDIVGSMTVKPKLVCIGCSTGGPEALSKIFRGLNKKPNYPILLVQHMPPMFTEKLASMLDKISPVDVVEAKEGMKVENGMCYVAPGDYHMTIDKNMIVKLNQDEKVCFVRPAVDVLFESVAKNYNDQVLSIILTGMGEDGARGCRALSDKGAYQFIQDKESSIVWGMPGAVSRTGIDVKTLTLDSFSSLLNKVTERI